VTEQLQLLLVDDDQSTLFAVPETLHLRFPELRVDICDSANKAVECIRATDYSAVITDTNLPGLDGLGFLREAAKVRPYLPVVVMTGRIDQDLLSQALRAGAYDFIRKPIDRDQLVLSVMRALEAHTLRVHFGRHQTLVKRLHQHLRQIDQVWTPALLTNLQAISRGVGKERMEHSRTLVMRALTLCETQAQLFRERIELSERYIQWATKRWSSGSEGR
jgi:DNA-binding NtrC family response regulator